MRKLPVSVFIIAKNEADRIARTIRSVISWADEVVVVDSESSDDTVQIARAEGCRVITQPWLGFGGQKRFAEEQCRNDWLLNVDADEVVTPELGREIVALFDRGTPSCVAYAMPIEMVYPDASKPRPFARDHWYVRLYDRRAVRFHDSDIHDSVITEGHAVGGLKGAMHHYSMRSFDDMIRKLDERTWLSVKHAGSQSLPTLLVRLAIELPVNFLKYYIGRRHFMGGLTGLRYSSIQSWFRFLKIYRLWCERSDRTLSGKATGGSAADHASPLQATWFEIAEGGQTAPALPDAVPTA